MHESKLTLERDAEPECCAFHGKGGSPDLACGGDDPGLSGIHLRDCAYLAGGDCTCGRGVGQEGGAE